MAIDDHLLLFTRLYERTRAGALAWAETVDENAFSVAFKDFSVHIYPTRGDHDETDYIFQIRNDNGEVVDQFRDTELADMFESNDSKFKLYQKVQSLYEIARRSARGADQAVKSILKQLDDDSPF